MKKRIFIKAALALLASSLLVLCARAATPVAGALADTCQKNREFTISGQTKIGTDWFLFNVAGTPTSLPFYDVVPEASAYPLALREPTDPINTPLTEGAIYATPKDGKNVAIVVQYTYGKYNKKGVLRAASVKTRLALFPRNPQFRLQEFINSPDPAAAVSVDAVGNTMLLNMPQIGTNNRVELERKMFCLEVDATGALTPGDCTDLLDITTQATFCTLPTGTHCVDSSGKVVHYALCSDGSLPVCSGGLNPTCPPGESFVCNDYETEKTCAKDRRYRDCNPLPDLSCAIGPDRECPVDYSLKCDAKTNDALCVHNVDLSPLAIPECSFSDTYCSPTLDVGCEVGPPRVCPPDTLFACDLAGNPVCVHAITDEDSPLASCTFVPCDSLVPAPGITCPR